MGRLAPLLLPEPSLAFSLHYDPRIARSSPASTEGRYARRGARQVKLALLTLP